MIGVLKVAYIGVRECFVKANASIIDNIKSSLESALSTVNISPKTKVNVFGDINKYITVEILGRHKANIKSIDLKIMSKLIEVFEKRGITHFFESLEINPDIPSKKKARKLNKIENNILTENIDQKNRLSEVEFENSLLKKRLLQIEERVDNLKLVSKI